MNVIICCAGTLGRGKWGKDLKKYVNVTHKSDLSLGKETIIQRMVRILKEEGLTDITIAYSTEKPHASGIKYRKVKYFSASQCSTFYQCRDLIKNTLIVEGDVICSKIVLQEILAQKFEEFLFIPHFMFLINEAGTKKFKNVFLTYKKYFETGKAGHRLGSWNKIAKKQFNLKIKVYSPKKIYIGDVDSQQDYQKWLRQFKAGVVDKL